MRCWRSEARDDAHRRDHRRLGFRRRRRNTGRPENLAALGVYGASVITALTAQNTKGVAAIHDVPADSSARRWMPCLRSRCRRGEDRDAQQCGVIAVVAAGLDRYRPQNVVLDPIMVASTGADLLHADAMDALRSLMSRALVLTPNLFEAGVLLDVPIARDEGEMRAQGERLLSLGPAAVLIKGGHGSGPDSVDILVEAGNYTRFAAPRIEPENARHRLHVGLGDRRRVAKGQNLYEAVGEAKVYVSAAIAAAGQLKIGSGRDPLHHFSKWW